jgi:hypothetical protein
MSRTSPRANDLLRRVAELPDPSRFAFRDLGSCGGPRYLNTFESLVEFGYIERVAEAVGQWFYRLTPKGQAVVAGENSVRFSGEIRLRERGYEPGAVVRHGVLTHRQNLHQPL